MKKNRALSALLFMSSSFVIGMDEHKVSAFSVWKPVVVQQTTQKTAVDRNLARVRARLEKEKNCKKIEFLYNAAQNEQDLELKSALLDKALIKAFETLHNIKTKKKK